VNRARQRTDPVRGLVVAPYGLVPAHDGARAHAKAHIGQLKELGHQVWYLGLGLRADEAAAMKEEWQDKFVQAPSLPWPQRRPLMKTVWSYARRATLSTLRLQPHVDGWYQIQWTEVASRLANRVAFDYVLVHYIFLTQIFKAFSPNVRKIVDTHDSFADLSRTLAAKGVDYRWYSCSPNNESKALRRADFVIANQSDEAKIFQGRVGSNCKVVTVGHPCPWQGLQEASTLSIGFLAGENPMNRAGLAWFVEKCWPTIRIEFPQCKLLVAGGICDIRGAWAHAPGVEIFGRVDDVRGFHMQTTLEINPVSAGSGLKIKSLESLAHGRALVSVSEGVTGLERGYGAFVVAETPDAFVGAVVRLLRNQSARAELIAGAERLIADWNGRQRLALACLFDGL